MQGVNFPFEKRIKRHLLSREHTFLAVVQPALRAVTGKELTALSFRILGETDGGVEFAGRLEEAWRANLLLRTVSRIYCRLTEFRARSREELFRKTSAFPWELWLAPGIPRTVEARIRYSRLRHEGEAAQTLLEAVDRRLREAGLEPLPAGTETAGGPETRPVQRLLLRAEDNRVQLSLDTSGEPLYNRGYRLEPAEAPIRESLAAALLLEAGWTGSEPLVDGMTGSGTFAVEAVLLGSGAPPSAGRSFLFQAWPSYREKAWLHLVKKAEEGCSASLRPQVLAVEIRDEILETAKRNAFRAGVGDGILWRLGDFFDLDGEAALEALGLSGERAGRGGIVFLNPPYGKRLEEAEPDAFGLLGEHLRRRFPCWRSCVLFPTNKSLAAFGGKPEKLLRFRHGGIVVTAGFFPAEGR